LHDLRRTACTNMAEHCGVMGDVIEAALNHKSGSKAGVAGVYNRAIYLEESRKALDKYGSYVLSLVS
jgi:hypothetical protein